MIAEDRGYTDSERVVLIPGMFLRPCPGACDRGYFRGEGREAGKVRNVAGESAWENLRQDLLLLVRKID